MCELLCAFEAAPSLSALAALMDRDASVVSRQLQRVAQAAPVLRKHQGRWQLSTLGRKIVSWSLDAASAQRRILNEQPLLRIASTREFSARVLSPGLTGFLAGHQGLSLSVLSAEDGVERLLTSNQADIGFDCGAPGDAAVRFKTVTEEPFVVLAAPAFLKRHRVRRANGLLPLPHLLYSRAPAARLLSVPDELPNVVASFNDIANVREACVAEIGWAVLPKYSVRRELDAGLLAALPGWKLRSERFGVWWLRERADLDAWVARAVAWLGAQSLV
jgi:DNA-binding transcriptional LysR family regulator